MRVVHPDRSAQFQRDGLDPLAVAGDQVELGRDQVPELVQRRRLAPERAHPGDVHVRRLVLQVEELGVQCAHPVHGGPLVGGACTTETNCPGRPLRRQLRCRWECRPDPARRPGPGCASMEPNTMPWKGSTRPPVEGAGQAPGDEQRPLVQDRLVAVVGLDARTPAMPRRAGASRPAAAAAGRARAPRPARSRRRSPTARCVGVAPAPAQADAAGQPVEQAPHRPGQREGVPATIATDALDRPPHRGRRWRPPDASASSR